jgi:hypothetical protein
MLPDDIRNLILDYAASIKEYEIRVRLHDELMTDYYFRKLHRIYTIFLNFNLMAN